MTAVIERDFISGLQVLRLSINFSITDHAIRRMLLSSSYKAKRKVSGKKKTFQFYVVLFKFHIYRCSLF